MSAARAIRKEHDMIKLIACDMDGTLLDSAKRLPAELPEVIAVSYTHLTLPTILLV